MSYIYYKVHETKSKKSPVIVEGNRQKIMDHFNMTNYAFYNDLQRNENILKKKHLVEKCPWPVGTKYFLQQKEEPKSKPEKKKSKVDLKIEEIEMLLRIHKNTIIYKDAKRVINQLAKDGYIVSVNHEPKRVIKHYLGGQEVYSECWILTLTERREPVNE